MRLFEIESDENAMYFVFINSNPPTYGYKRALETLKELSKNANHVAFINPAYDGDSVYPLPFKKALEFNKKIFNDVTFYNRDDVQNPIQALKKLSGKYSKIYFVTRDKNIKDYNRMHQYAENWGIESFDIIGLGDSKRPLPTGTSKEVSMDAVMDNDYDAFKSTIPSNNSALVSDLFITLRKEVIDEKDEKINVDESYLCLLALAKFNRHVLSEQCKDDYLGNEVLVLENFINKFKNLKLVLSNSFKGTALGKDKFDNYVIMMKTDSEKLQQYLELNEESIKKVLTHYIKESITSGSIASSTTILGDPIRRDIDYSFLKDIKKSNSLNKKLDAMNYVINNYGFIDKDVIDTIEEKFND